MNWTPLDFGKHKGKTLPQVIFCDPDWFFWSIKVDAYKVVFHHREALDLEKKAKNIRIPPSYGENVEVEYVVNAHRMDFFQISKVGKFSHFEIVSKDKPLHIGSSYTDRKNVIDLSYPVRFARYDKKGCKLMISCLKGCYFKNTSYLMNKIRCEKFFEDDNNFLI